ncbi:hypothetical protein CCP4SC76_3060027 [Gammaproteobacteria bacterium]
MSPLATRAAEDQAFPTLPEVTATATRLETPTQTETTLGNSQIQPRRAATSDTALLLDGVPGVSLYGGGGVSSLPAIHGMADDRVNVLVDGIKLMSACPNHMNAPLSYIDPTHLSNIKVLAGITPVSVGGDSIGGTVQVNSAAPEFAQAGQKTMIII